MIFSTADNTRGYIVLRFILFVLLGMVLAVTLYLLAGKILNNNPNTVERGTVSMCGK